MAQYTTEQLKDIIRDAARRYGIDENIGIRQLARESVNFNPYYVFGPGQSPAGAKGLAQFIDGTWARYGSGSPYNPVAAADAWGRYMRDLLNMFSGRYDLALAGYNWGENRTTLRNALASGRSILDYSIPAETRGYVSGILGSAAGVVSIPGTVSQPPPSDPFVEVDIGVQGDFYQPTSTNIVSVVAVGVVAIVVLWAADVI